MTNDEPAPLFEGFWVFGLNREGSRLSPNVRYCFQEGDPAFIKAVSEFCFPDVEDSETLHSESFTFTLTGNEGSRVSGFARRLTQESSAPGSSPPSSLPICLCILTKRPWFSFFMHMLDILQLNYDLDTFVPAFVSAAHATPFPPPGGSFAVTPLLPILDGDVGCGGVRPATFRLTCPEEDRATGVSFEPLLSALGVAGVLRVLGALMTEQRIIFVGARWGHVSTCAHAALALLYPMQWQHIFIPVLPISKLSYACAPMPFVLGVLSRHLPQLMQEPLDAVLFVDVDSGSLTGEAPAECQLPRPHRDALEVSLSKLIKQQQRELSDNAAVADAVLQFMVSLLGPYRTFVSRSESESTGNRGELNADFDEKAFIEAAPPLAQPFLHLMRSAQLFEVFINTHIAMSPQAQLQSAFERALRRLGKADAGDRQGDRHSSFFSVQRQQAFLRGAGLTERTTAAWSSAKGLAGPQVDRAAERLWSGVASLRPLQGTPTR